MMTKSLSNPDRSVVLVPSKVVSRALLGFTWRLSALLFGRLGGLGQKNPNRYPLLPAGFISGPVAKPDTEANEISHAQGTRANPHKPGFLRRTI